jgi:hypothetical protein
MTYESERLQILEMIERGVISAAEGVRLLNALTGNPSEIPSSSVFPETETAPRFTGGFASRTAEIPQPEAEPAYEEPAPQAAQAAPDLGASASKWRRWWWIPLWVGVGITVISGALMYLAFANNRFGFWFACTWFPFLLGVAVMALAWASRTARWLHVRVHQQGNEWPRNIAISLPLPLRFTAWIVRLFRPRIPNMEGVNIDEMILALEKTSPSSPMFVQVDEGKDGERVEVYIG